MGKNKKVKNVQQKKARPYLFIPRKGQITISFLLIFLILFSLFAVGLVAEREMWASAKFKAAVDAAALSAGADMAKAADLMITLTAVRFGLFAISMVLYILSIPFPAIFPAANSVNNVSKEISKLLGEFSRFVPAIYIVKAEIDAYDVFKEDFGLRDQGISNWSPNDYGIIVVPTYAIKEISNKEFNLLPFGDNLEKSIDLLEQGVTVFGYRRLSYLEQLKNNLNIQNRTSNSFLDFLSTHEALFASSIIGKTNPNDSGIDLSDVIKIDNFLKIWEGKELNKKQTKDNTLATLGKILEAAQVVVDRVKDIKTTIAFERNEYYESYSYNYQAVQAAKKITCNNNDCNNCDNINYAIEHWISFCEGHDMWNNNNKNPFQGDVNYTKEYAYGFGKNNLASLIENYEKYLNELDPNNTNQPKTLPERIDKIREKIEKIKNFATKAKDELTGEINNLEKLRCEKTVQKTDKDGKIYYETEYYIIPGIDSTINPMLSAKSELESIIDACDNALEEINKAANNLNKATEESIDTVKEDFLNNIFEGLSGITGAFKGFPGGRTLAAIFRKYDCKEDQTNIEPAYNSEKCLGCSLPVIGNLACAFQRDINQLTSVLKGDKFDIASYYSAVLTIPEFLSTETTQLNIKCDSKDYINCAIDDLSDGIKNNISFDVDNDNKLNEADILITLGGTVISGILSGGVTVIIGILLDFLIESVIKPLINDIIKVKLVPWLRSLLTNITNRLLEDTKNTINSALGKFIEFYNNINAINLRLIGKSNLIDINWSFVRFINNLAIRVSPNKRFDLVAILNEETYAYS